MGRIFQSSFQEVDPALIEAAKSFGASKIQIIFKVMFVEAIPSIISGLSLSIINLLGATAMAGAIGAGVWERQHYSMDIRILMKRSCTALW